jgi:hypothetical protein
VLSGVSLGVLDGPGTTSPFGSVTCAAAGAATSEIEQASQRKRGESMDAIVRA